MAAMKMHSWRRYSRDSIAGPGTDKLTPRCQLDAQDRAHEKNNHTRGGRSSFGIVGLRGA
jgi:hypothetical protein